MKKVISFICVTLILISMTSCINSTKSKLVGSWEGSFSYFDHLEFFSNGTYVSDHPNYEGSYTVENDRLKLQGVLVESIVITFDVTDDTLTLYYDDGTASTFNRTD